MATYQKFHPFTEHLAEGAHDLAADTLRVMLTNTAPADSNALKSDIAEIAAGAGYPAGGIQAVVSSSGQTGGIYKLVLADVVITASGGSVGPFRYAVLYNDSATTPLKPLIARWDYGSSITLLDGESFTWDADPATGVLQLQ